MDDYKEERCETCKNWEASSVDFGKCTAISDNNSVMMAEIIVDADTEEHVIETKLETNREFGCVLWWRV